MRGPEGRSLNVGPARESLCENPTQAAKTLTPGRVPHVRPSVHRPDTIFFECSYSICHGVIGGVRALEGLCPSYSAHVRWGEHGPRPGVKVLWREWGSHADSGGLGLNSEDDLPAPPVGAP